MSRRLLLLALVTTTAGATGPGSAPGVVTVSTSRGEVSVAVRSERGHPVLSAPELSAVLPLTIAVDADWASVGLGGQPFRFLLGAPLFEHAGRIVPLAGGAYLWHDTLFVPLQWLADYVPRVFREAYRYDFLAARFEEAALAPVVHTAPASPMGPPVASAPPRRDPARSVVPGSPLKMRHTVVLDAGHGGVDPGNPGLFLPRGVREKDVNLAIARVLRTELESRGIDVLMTRTTDTLIAFSDRARLCEGPCDLFVSIHINSLARRRGYTDIGGFETYFLSEARTAEAQRVADMENEALRYETDRDPSADEQFAFILKDLQTNEHLRESAALADAVQRHGGRAHPGGDRGVSQARFAVLSYARRPAILIEAGYSTNRRDAQFLATVAGQRRLARAIADGIVEYLVQYERKLAAASP
jgi:N-acetylmuramoyl-L-alanine amidase